MTATAVMDSSPTESSPTAPKPTSAAPRKRRRRTAATGASEDCFACRKRQTKCDRKRPYCGQCLEVGKECSGYRTTLTWGVGVASRGKLRGLSCPIAMKASDDAASTKKADTTSPQRRKHSVSRTNAEAKAAVRPENLAQPPTQAPSDVATGVDNGLYIKSESTSDARPPRSLPVPIPLTTPFWSDNYAQHPASPSWIPQQQHHGFPVGLQPLQTTMSMSQMLDDRSFPTSASTASTYSDGNYLTPNEFPRTPGSFPFSDAFPPFFGNTYHDQHVDENSADSLSYPGMAAYSNPTSPTHSLGPDGQSLNHMSTSLSAVTHPEPFNGRYAVDNTIYGSITGEELEYNEYDLDMNDSEVQDVQSEANGLASDMSLGLPRAVFTSTFYHLSPRTQVLLDYYSRNICPVLVAFDGQANPYRLHILQLAAHNKGLQNAIAALATNNMRMRSLKEVGRLAVLEALSDVAAPTAEELRYKKLSIDQLNLQLTDPRSAQDDSVLATLLILCLFHVCDSGFSKFKTQLAGVQKLLSMRTPSIQNEFTGWVEMFFTWFDVMTSAVNDRETQIQGESLDMMDYSANLGALEQYSGCDGRLFKIIARLGRLNLLSQNRPVREQQGFRELTPRPPPSPRSQSSSRWRELKRNKRKFDPSEFDRLDGNGWGATIPEEDAAGSADEEIRPMDERHEFWSEWHDIRARLQAWEMDVSTLPSPSAQSPGGYQQLGPEQRDLVHISESFRYSALLYTERLAHPTLASSSQNFQGLVSQALFHITALSITSCVHKFLLWPLFMTGTECVDEGHRATIRHRCVEIQRESGFFNNLSGLEVLERVWKETGSAMEGGEVEEVRRRRRDSTSSGKRWGQAFRWRRAMDRIDGEYIVI
ncbi:hypothetical protein H2203_008629 [Taxawa tesnikishii (nom. ined.)]|nr:hypothetical protein H2203_008629 [Dothideales sp. JES 119]